MTGGGKYRSMIVITGATRPDAHAADMMSEPTRQGRSLVFHFGALMATGEEVAEEVRGEEDGSGALFNARELESSPRLALEVMIGWRGGSLIF